MLDSTQSFIETAAKFLDMRHKEAGAGSIIKTKAKQQAKKVSTGVPGYSSVSSALDPRLAKSIDESAEAATKGIESRTAQIQKSIDEKFAKPEPQGYTPSAGDVTPPPVRHISPTLAETTVNQDLKDLVTDTKFARKKTYGANVDKGSMSHADLQSFRGLMKDKYPNLSDAQIDSITLKYSRPGTVSRFVRENPKKSIVGGASTLAATAEATGLTDVIPDTPEGAAVDNYKVTPESSKEALKQFEETATEQPPATGGESGEDKAEASDGNWVDKLSDKGSNMLQSIQNFANTKSGAATIGGATGAGIAYLADKLFTKDDEEEDTKGRRVLLTLLGGALGAGAGYGLQAYRQKNASDQDDSPKVRAALRQEAASLSDEDLEKKVASLESMEKVASSKDWILDRLYLHCKVA